MPPGAFNDIRTKLILQHCKWDPQVEDVSTLAPFPLLIRRSEWSQLCADAEALGRLISLQLRATAPQNRMEMLKLVIDQLQNIGGARPGCQ